MKRGDSMAKKSLIDAFEVKSSGLKIKNISDYEVFKDSLTKDSIDYDDLTSTLSFHYFTKVSHPLYGGLI